MLRIIKQIESSDLKELLPFIGKKVEIIISPLTDDKDNKTDMFEIIEKCSGTVIPWTREELYDRQIFP
ncbi:MAG: hypothetical protein BWK80_18520 [Desulfobacteraceae bacterium IS3]|nr:MAG: hypothetical protein BWK80_18520 [Desulfobacteraceae bacterium IS3]